MMPKNTNSRILSALLLLHLATPVLASALLDSCMPNKALALLNQSNPPLDNIKTMLILCDQRSPDDLQVLLLHGLVARKEHHYSDAIAWLQKARTQADSSNFIPAQELALTYEWANQDDKAQTIYNEILASVPNSEPALLGLARIALVNQDTEKAMAIYNSLLNTNARNIEALNGMGRTLLTLHQLPEAKRYFERALQLANNNPDAKIGLAQINAASAHTNQILLSSIPAIPRAPFISAQIVKAQNKTTTAPTLSLCDTNKGLLLLNSKPVLLDRIKNIMRYCDQEKPADTQVLLMHGLLARVQKNYPLAIQWLTKARQTAPSYNPVPAQELALTYEWAQQPQQALTIYNSLLRQYPDLRAAWFGIARIAMAGQRIEQAARIYERFLQKNPQDIDALNGLARVQMAQQHYDAARQYLRQVMEIQPGNESAVIALQQINMALMSRQQSVSNAILPVAPKPSPCDTARGLILLNSPQFLLADVQQILSWCDRENHHDAQVLLLRGLLARKQKHYDEAIVWLKQARAIAAADDPVPEQELALTYEWSNQPGKALQIYNDILAKNPGSRSALLGLGRVNLGMYRISAAKQIYTELLQKNPRDLDALNGMGSLKLTNKQFTQARSYFNQALTVQPGNLNALSGLNLLNDSTRFMLSLSEGQYLIDGEHSNSSTAYGYVDLNASDRLIVILTHNTKELQLDIPTNPTVLPSNSYFFDFQRQFPDRYGWGVTYDYRERTTFPVENRVGGNANIYVLPRLQVLGGFWLGSPSPWNNQLYYSAITLYTDLPFNITTTGYWTMLETGGREATYAFDLSKEYSNRAYYDIGTAYLPTQKSWQGHGNFILPISKNQALEGRYEYYHFNGATIYALGWRMYWA